MGLGLQQDTLLPLRGFLCLFFVEHLFTFLELLPSLTLLSGGYTDALLSREVIGEVLLQSVWCVLLGVI